MKIERFLAIALGGKLSQARGRGKKGISMPQKTTTGIFRLVTHAFPALALMGVLAPAVHAGCGEVKSIQAPYVFPAGQADAAQALTQKAADASRALTLGPAAQHGGLSLPTIVGLWKFQFVSQGNTLRSPSIPDGAQVDFGYTQWHSDGTELMNSGIHSPASGNFCVGTWVRSGFFSYELSHFALSYDPATGNLAAKIHILERVTLDPGGNEFAGSFTLDAYDPQSGDKIDHVIGTVSATRITVDQDIP